MSSTDRMRSSWNLLRYSYGIVILLVGLDKVFGLGLIADWPMYVSPLALSLLPVSMPTFLITIGIIEVVVAIMLLTKWPNLAGYISIAWLVLIAADLLLAGYVDVAVRDLLLAVAVYVFTELTAMIEKPNNA